MSKGLCIITSRTLPEWLVPGDEMSKHPMAQWELRINAHTMEHIHCRNSNVKGVVDDTTVHAQKCDTCLRTLVF